MSKLNNNKQKKNPGSYHLGTQTQEFSIKYQEVPRTHKNDYFFKKGQIELTPGMQRWSNIWQLIYSINNVCNSNRLKDKIIDILK